MSPWNNGRPNLRYLFCATIRCIPPILQFEILQIWSTVKDNQIIRFIRDSRDVLPSGQDADRPLVCISTYSMVAYSGKRAFLAEESMKYLENKEWGLLILDGIWKLFFD